MLLSVYISLKVHRYCKSRISISFKEDNSSMTHILLPLSSERRFSLIRRNVYNSSESFFLIFVLVKTSGCQPNVLMSTDFALYFDRPFVCDAYGSFK